MFTEFMEMVESQFSTEVMDDILEAANVYSGGSYTSLGSYDYTEIIELVGHLSRITKTDTDTGGLVQAFFENIDNAMGFLEKVDGYIHIEVKKLYPDAELFRLNCARQDDGQML